MLSAPTTAGYGFAVLRLRGAARRLPLGGGLQVGQRVEVQPSMMQNPAAAIWQTGTLTEVLSPRVVRVLGDDGGTYDIITDQPQQWVRPAGAQAAAPPTPAAPPAPVPQRPLGIQGYQVGQRVEVQPTMLNNPGPGATWVAGTITEIMGPNAVRVLADDGYTYDILLSGKKWIRAAAQGAKTPVAIPPTAANTAKPPAPQPGLGAPPDGVYTVMMVTGGAMAASGKLVIRGHSPGPRSGLI